MKSGFKNCLLVFLLALLCGLIQPLSAQTFKTLYSFSFLVPYTTSAGYIIYTNSDGAQPNGGLILQEGRLYGTTYRGGASAGLGTAFAVNSIGAGFTNLHTFGPDGLGQTPEGGLLLISNNLYGTTSQGGVKLGGTLFAMDTNGLGYRTLHSFPDPALGGLGRPIGTLIFCDGTIYGSTGAPSPAGPAGSVFGISPDGSNFRSLNYSGMSSGVLLISNEILYWTDSHLGGAIFSCTTNLSTGSSKAVHIFSQIPPYTDFETNFDGFQPSSLVISGDTLYGTATLGGTLGLGTVFRVNVDGTSFRVLHTFTGFSDGANPLGLVLLGDTLYGSASGYGPLGNGLLFAMNKDGTSFRIIYTFSPLTGNLINSDGAVPQGGLLLVGDKLFGVTYKGGTGGSGVVFSFELPPQLTISSEASAIILSWPTNFSGFTLQSTTNLYSPDWTANLPSPTIINGQYTVTNPISRTQQFFRLSQ